MGGFTVRQRIAVLGSVGVAAMLGFLLFWGGIGGKPASAMEKMAESIRKAKSFKAAMNTECKAATEPGKPPVEYMYRFSGTIYCAASGAVRLDLKGDLKGNAPGYLIGEQHFTEIHCAGKQSVFNVDHKRKMFHRSDDAPRRAGGLEIEVMEGLGGFSGQADRDLGVREINGKKARGFEIDMKKLFPPPRGDDDPSKDVAEVWIAPESSLPVLVEFRFNTDLKRKGGGTGFIRMRDFQWNIDLDPKLFDTTPPEGYTDISPPKPSEKNGESR
jgi:hypothetical protein